jgi:predicted RNA-binding protein YlqC (UPF0109 family)
VPAPDMFNASKLSRIPKARPTNAMSKPIAKFTDSLRQLGEIHVNDWDFMALMHKDIKEIEFTKSLRKLGNIRVMEWDFRTVLPAVNQLANHEVDLTGILRRTANYKVMEWDFRKPFPSEHKPAPRDAEVAHPLSREEMQALIGRLKDFIQYVVVNLIDEPNHAHVRIQEIAPNVLRLKLVLTKRDVAMLIGTGGHTAAAIRRLVKDSARAKGVHALLQIHSHEEEIAEHEIS